MRYLTIGAVVALLTAMAFSSCTCHDQLDAPPGIDDSATGFSAKMSSPATTPVTTPSQAPATATQQVKPTFEVLPSPTPPDRLPTDFPSEVPVIPGSTLSQVQDMANSARNVLFTSEKPVNELVKTYDETMTKAGWRVTQKFEREKHAFATYEKGKMLVNVTIATDVDAPGQQVIAVMYEEQKPLEFDMDDGDE